MLDTSEQHNYNYDQVLQIVNAANAAKAFLTELAKLGDCMPTNLDNGITQEAIAPCCKEDDNMASQHREVYNYLDADGHLQKIRINGHNKQDTDAKFQALINQGFTQQQQYPLMREFVDKTFRPNFIETLQATTIDNYTFYLNSYILPFMGDKRMNQVSVADVQSFINWMATASQHGRRNDINAASIRRVCGLLGRIFAIAVEMKQAPDNPVKWKLLRNNGKPASHHKAADDADVIRPCLKIHRLHKSSKGCKL